MNIADDAFAFFDACETGKGWEACAPYCHEDARFSAQADALEELTTVAGYCAWMQGLLGPVSDGRYELKAFAVDEVRQVALIFAVFHGSHVSDGGPVPPTGKSVAADYVYALAFESGKIRSMTKIWNDAQSLRALGWS